MACPSNQINTNFSPEQTLLLCCACVEITPSKTAKALTLIQNKINWQHLITLASNHRIIPLLYQNLNRSPLKKCVPNFILNQLKELNNTNVRRILFLTSELIKLLKLLQAQGIPALPYKGPTLAHVYYKNLALRQAGDLDILISKKDFFKTKNILIAQGFRPNIDFELTQEKYLLHHYYVRTFSRNNLCVELHWATETCIAPLSFDFEELNKDSRKIDLDGFEINLFSPENTLLTLCFHGTRHIWSRLSWICDIAEILRTNKDLNWPDVLNKAKLLGRKNMLLLGLYLAHDLLETSLPHEILKEFKNKSVVFCLEQEVITHLRTQEYNSFSSNIKYDFYMRMFYLRALTSWRGKIILFLHYWCPNQRDFTLISFPKKLFFLYYLLRALRIIRKYLLLMPFSFLKRKK